MAKMGTIGWIAWILVIIGGLNWGLVGVADIDLVNTLFGVSTLARVIYILVGLGTLYMIYGATKKSGGMSQTM